MGMRAYACFVCVVKKDFVKLIAPEEYLILADLLANNDIDWDTFAQIIMYEDSLGYYEENTEEILINAYDKLINKFNDKTKLSLSLGYIDSEVDSDMEEGLFWAVDGAMEPTKAGKKYANEINFESYVTFG